MTETCRVCGTTRKNLSTPFINSAQKLEAIIGIKINISTSLPSKLCRKCFSRIEDAYSLREQCLKIETIYSNSTIEEYEVYEKLVIDDTAVDTLDDTQEDEKVEIDKLEECEFQEISDVSLDLIKVEGFPLKNCENEQEIKKEFETELPIVPISEQKTQKIPLPKSSKTKQKTIISSEEPQKSMTLPINKAPPLPTDSPSNCCQCKYKNKNPTKTLQHFIQKHLKRRNASKYEPGCCRLCWVFFPNLEDLEKHTQGPLSGQPGFDDIDPDHVCPHCNKVYLHKNTLRSHIQFVHTEPKLVCNFCSAKFGSNQRLRLHINKEHYDLKEFQCDICKKFFRTKNNLKRHIVWHVGIKSYLCEYCGKAFGDKTDCRRHEVVHTKINLYNCTYPDCGKGYQYKHKLTSHMLSHETAPPSS